MSNNVGASPIELMDALDEAGVIDIYFSLPQADRARFTRWIKMARDDDSYWRRIEAIVVAMRLSPLILKVARAKDEPQQAMDV